MKFLTLLLFLALTLTSCYYPRGWHMMDWGTDFGALEVLLCG